jgi:hypothetical protein
MSRHRSAETASHWPGPFEPRRRDIDGAAQDEWAADERRQRSGGARCGLTEPDLRRLVAAFDPLPEQRYRAA